MNDLIRLEETLWQQRSHTHWMVSGDRNTSYFHNRASQRFRRNNISKLRALDGRLVSGDENVSALIVEYYQLLFTSSNPSDIEEVVQLTNRRVDDTMNVELTSEFTKAEVEVALKHMAPLKAPGQMACPLYFSNITGIALVMT